jgi:hypothetical protein
MGRRNTERRAGLEKGDTKADLQALVDVRVAGQKVFEISRMLQFLSVIGHAGLRQHTGDPIFQLYGLLPQEVAIPQAPPPFANVRRDHAAFRCLARRRHNFCGIYWGNACGESVTMRTDLDKGISDLKGVAN